MERYWRALHYLSGAAAAAHAAAEDGFHSTLAAGSPIVAGKLRRAEHARPGVGHALALAAKPWRERSQAQYHGALDRPKER